MDNSGIADSDMRKSEGTREWRTHRAFYETSHEQARSPDLPSLRRSCESRILYESDI